MAGWFPLFAPAVSGFNGGRSQINLNGIGGGEYAFANVCLYGSDWLYGGGINANGRVSLAERDANGMPTSLSAGAVYAAASIPASAARPGNYVIRTTGTGSATATGVGSLGTASFTGVLSSGVLTVSGLTGTISKGQALLGAGVTAGSCIGAQLSGTTYQINNYLTGASSAQTLGSVAMTTSNGSTSVSGTGRIVFYPGDSGSPQVLTYYITSIGSPSISQYAVTHVDDEMAWVLDPWAFNPKFKSVIQAAKWGAIRDLNWSAANISNATTWATRKTKTWFSFGTDEFRTSLNAGTATHSNGSTVAIAAVSYNAGTGLATIQTSTAHGQTGTFQVAIENRGGYPTYNGQFTATVVDATHFTYPLSYTPAAPTTLGTANIGVYDYAISFNDPTYGNGAPVAKQTFHFYFDRLACTNSNFAITFSGTKTCNWSGHTFVGGERIGFMKGSANLPVNVGQGQTYYVLPTNIVPGVSFEFSLTSGGTAVTFSGASGTQIGARLHLVSLNGTTSYPLLTMFASPLIPPPDFSDPNTQGTVPSPIQQFGQICLATVTFDETLGAFLLAGGSLDGDAGLINASPPEIFLKLCNEVGAYSHHAIPVLALDPQTDYVPQLYTLAKTVAYNIPRFENANEVWNSNQPVTGYARAVSFVLWNAQFGNGVFDEASWMGKVNSTTGQILAAMAGSVGNGYRLTLAMQTVGFASPGDGGQGSKFTSTNYVGQSQAAQTLSVPALSFNIAFSKTAAYLYGTHAVGANYLTPAGYDTFNAAIFIANYAMCTGFISAGVLNVTGLTNGVGTLKVGQAITDHYGQIPTGVTIISLGTGTGGVGTYNLSNSGFNCISTTIVAQNSTSIAQADAFVDNLNGAAANYNNAQILIYFTNLKNYALTLPNNLAGVKMGVSFYEGGYGLDYVFGPSLSAVYHAAKYSQYIGVALCNGGLMANGTTINGCYKDLIALGADFPSAYLIGGSFNQWSLADPDIYVTPTLPSYQAIVAFNL